LTLYYNHAIVVISLIRGGTGTTTGRSEPTSKGEITMYKRFSIVNQAQLVKLLEKKGLHEYGGLQELLRFLYEIQLLALLGETNYKGAALDQDGSMERFFSGDTKEHKKLTEALGEAHRVSVYIRKPTTDPGGYFIQADLMFHHRGKRESFYTLKVWSSVSGSLLTDIL